ncbi:MAG: guanylate kinase [Rhodospirillaceae bacterium]|jgi:guanylate kinase|nr:guanylate kinase [Rhodospirillaceae bacterium]MBT5242105.1 guanylate kinase [Rhodospirillaceae bacterium]MBT5565831.1 guanylate kinase [Rhodospirillaceae bacterium]MBT6090276.1 guanylate kinase [Rhodospirillaceae bacterium]MBT6960864.1 guanylate kinase [Rhodospirillaceae bacterium]
MPGSVIQRRGLMLVLSSPSGAGKSTIARALLEREDELYLSISLTTRPPRPGEEEGRDYFFVTEDEYQKKVNDNELLEHARVFNNYYGTPRTLVERHLTAGEDVLFDIDWQGTQQLRESARDDVISIFILPPSYEELEKRLTGRGQDSEDVVSKRMAKASDEMSHWPEYDYVIVNDEIEESIQNVQAILKAERLRKMRRLGLGDFVKSIRRKG